MRKRRGFLGNLPQPRTLKINRRRNVSYFPIKYIDLRPTVEFPNPFRTHHRRLTPDREYNGLLKNIEIPPYWQYLLDTPVP